jgi:hypothetical protein
LRFSGSHFLSFCAFGFGLAFSSSSSLELGGSPASSAPAFLRFLALRAFFASSVSDLLRSSISSSSQIGFGECSMNCLWRDDELLVAGLKLVPWLEQIQRKFQVRGSTPENGPRIRAGVEKKEQQAELKTKKARSR